MTAVLFFWRGLYHLNRSAAGEIAAARDHSERAAAIDPGIDWVWALLAHCHFQLADRGHVPVAEAKLPRSTELQRNAVRAHGYYAA